MELSELTEEQKIQLFKLVKSTYPWANRKKNIVTLAKSLIVTNKFKI